MPQCEQNLRSKATGKCGRIKEEKYGQISYIQQNKIHVVREQCRTRWGLLPFAGNYSKDKRFAKTSWLCVCGEEREEQHLISGHCKVYGDLTHKYDNLAEDNQLVQFFEEVLARREDLEVETCGSGVDTTVGANSGPEDQDKPAQGS